MDSPRAATATHGAAPYGVVSDSNFPLERNTGDAPRLRARQPESGASLLPDELIGQVLQHLPLSDLAAAYQVCQRWHAMENFTG